MQLLLGSPRQDLDEATVRSALSHLHGTRVRHGVDVLDHDDFPTGEPLDWETGSVTWSYRPPQRATGNSTDVAETRRRADLTVVSPPFHIVERRYRIWTELQAADGTWVRFHLGVFVAANPSIEDDGHVVRHRVKLADKTYVYATSHLEEPVVPAAATNPITYVRNSLTSEFGESAFSIPATTYTTSEPRRFDPGTSWHAHYTAMLEMAAYDALTVDESGRPRSLPLAAVSSRGPETTYSDEPGGGLIRPAGSVDPLLPTLPNVVRFVARQGPSLPSEGNGIATRRNRSTGPASIDRRGREVLIRVDVEAENQAELNSIADADAGRYFAGGGLRYSGAVALNPLHSDRDVIRLVRPRLGLDVICDVTEWTYPLRRDISSEDAVTMPIAFEARVDVEAA